MNHPDVFPELQGLERIFPNLKVLGKVGKGGVCSVFEILDTTHDRLVALKIMHPEIVRDAAMLGREPEMMQRFHQECRLGVELPRRKVPRIPQVYADFKLGERPAVLMQYIRGDSLDSLAPVMDQWAGIAMIHQVAESLMRLHEEGVIHGDLTLENTILDNSGMVWILDLGIARTRGPAWPRIIDDERPVYGKRGYTAPEILKTKMMMSPESDMYTMGMFMMVLMIGRFPSADGQPAQAGGFGWLAEDLDRVCTECRSSDPGSRPDSRALFRRIDAVWKDGQPQLTPQEYLVRWQTRVPGRKTILFTPGEQVETDPETGTPPGTDQPAGPAGPDRGGSAEVPPVPSGPADPDIGVRQPRPVTVHEGSGGTNRWFSTVIPVLAGIVLIVTLGWLWLVPEKTQEPVVEPMAGPAGTEDAGLQEAGSEPLSARALTMAETGEFGEALELLDAEGYSEDDYLVRLIEAARVHEQPESFPVDSTARQNRHAEEM